MVRRIAHDTNTDHSRNPHKEDPFYGRPCQLGSYSYDSLDHVHRHVATVFATGRNIRFRPSATAILANPFPHAALLRGPDTTRENVADAPIVALKSREASPHKRKAQTSFQGGVQHERQQ
jgi:hypothetical protein